MKTVNSLSGGKTSSYLAVHYPADIDVFALVCVDDPKCSPKDKSLLQKVNDRLDRSGGLQKHGEFIATAEDDKILNVMFDLEQMIGREIVWVRGASFDKIIDKKSMLPNMGMRYCTTELKILPIGQYLCQTTELPVIMNQGIRMDEAERAKIGEKSNYINKFIVGKHKSGRNKWKEFFWAIADYPLIKDAIFYPQIIGFWENKNITFPNDSNCIGCFWKDIQQLRKNWDDQTQKMQWFSNQEKRINHFFKPGLDYDQIKKVNIQLDFNLGTGAGCKAGWCTN